MRGGYLLRLVVLAWVGWFFWCAKKTWAQTYYFDFSLPSVVIPTAKEVTVRFKYSFQGYQEKDFVVVPKVDQGLVEIYQSENKKWVGSSSLRNNFPN